MSVGRATQAEKPVTLERLEQQAKKCWLVHTHKATRTDVPDMEIPSKKVSGYLK